jgi:hypothetical protein
VSAVLLLWVAAGCAGVGPTLKPEVVSAVNSTVVRGFLPQNQVKAEYLQSHYGNGGGLIGAIIDTTVTSGLQSSAEKRVRELRAHAGDVDFRRLHWEAVSNTVMGISWLKADEFEEIAGASLPRVTKKMVAQNAVLNIGTDYYISQDCRVFVVSTGMGFFPPGRPGVPKSVNIVSYHSAEIGKPDADEAIALWAADNAAAYRKAVQEGIQENAKLVRYALEYMGGVASAKERHVTVSAHLLHARGDFGIKVGMMTMKGTILEEGADRLIFRSDAGRFFSLPRGEVVVK